MDQLNIQMKNNSLSESNKKLVKMFW